VKSCASIREEGRNSAIYCSVAASRVTSRSISSLCSMAGFTLTPRVLRPYLVALFSLSRYDSQFVILAGS